MHRYLRSALVGAATGMRTSAGPLVAAWVARGNPPASRGVPFLAEVVCDKLPFVGSRVKPGPLVGRAAAAGYAAATLAKDAGDAESRMPIVVTAACVAVATAFVAQRARAALVRRTGIPDPVLALAEDALCIALMVVVVAS